MQEPVCKLLFACRYAVQMLPRFKAVSPAKAAQATDTTSSRDQDAPSFEPRGADSSQQLLSTFTKPQLAASEAPEAERRAGAPSAEASRAAKARGSKQRAGQALATGAAARDVAVAAPTDCSSSSHSIALVPTHQEQRARKALQVLQRA